MDVVLEGFEKSHLEMIAAALAIVSPGGGGSPQYTVYRKFRAQVEAQIGGSLEDERHFERFSNIVLHESEEAGLIQILRSE
jgi:hypothetical protein